MSRTSAAAILRSHRIDARRDPMLKLARCSSWIEATPAAAQAGQAVPPGAVESRFTPEEQAAPNDLALVLARAMIAAAKADDHIDAAGQQRIFSRIDAFGLTAEQKGFVMDELAKPLDVNAVASAAATPEIAAEIYAASLLAIDPDGTAERGYLAMLAARLGLDADLAARLRERVERAAPVAWASIYILSCRFVCGR